MWLVPQATLLNFTLCKKSTYMFRLPVLATNNIVACRVGCVLPSGWLIVRPMMLSGVPVRMVNVRFCFICVSLLA